MQLERSTGIAALFIIVLKGCKLTVVFEMVYAILYLFVDGFYRCRIVMLALFEYLMCENTPCVMGWVKAVGMH